MHHAALDLSGQARVELLDRSDPAVREALEAMLEQEDAEMVPDRPAWEHADGLLDRPAAQLAAGEQVGPYVVESKIGAGGVEAQNAIDQLKELSVHSYIAPYNVAVIYAGLGEKDQAFTWLERALWGSILFTGAVSYNWRPFTIKATYGV